MVQIQQLSTTTSFTTSDLIPIFSSSNGVDMKATGAQLLAFVEANFASPEYDTVISAPIAGFNQQLASSTTGIWLILNPAGTLATGTITLPAVADCFDGQQIIVTSSAVITALTLTGNGATIVGGPSSIAAGGFFALRLNALQSKWYCVASSLGSTALFADITITGDILDANGNELVHFVTTPAAVNEVSVTNAAASSGPIIGASGNDTNIDLSIASKGTGDLVLETGGDFTATAADTVNIVATAGTATFQAATSANIAATAGDVTIDASDDVTISAGDEIAITGGDVLVTGSGSVGVVASGNLSLLTSESIVTRQEAPGVLNATGTLTAAMILERIVTSTTAAAVAATLDTGTAMEAVFAALGTDGSIDWSAIATGANAFTVTASAGHTIVGSGTVNSGASGAYRTRRTAANTYVTYVLARG